MCLLVVKFGATTNSATRIGLRKLVAADKEETEHVAMLCTLRSRFIAMTPCEMLSIAHHSC
ncbi:hypothetical protein HMPREF0183_0501 [Brevibacterium mcbrellneri ATCC 49030]|uniref:Uncharacterized protein n=1 Tax=Brevibacterium mcbrellneri ATCC 49030 TaxID=585530 RepID=D4YKP1_9MICO|nr:hypothetical protein HMPREF0183_0501 [Brevibacterium mcbrellneri ATCC 49030]